MSDMQWSEWIEYMGGGQPVPDDTIVQLEYEKGEGPLSETGDRADNYSWGPYPGQGCERYRYQLPAESGIAHADEDECIQLAFERMNKEQKYSAYFKDVRHIETLDVYRVIDLFGCEKHGHPISHAVKKLLLSGARTGGKDVEHDVREAIDSLHRWLEMREEDRV